MTIATDSVDREMIEKPRRWDIVESINRKTLTKLIEKGILTEEELKGMYDQYFTNWIRKSSIPITISNI